MKKTLLIFGICAAMVACNEAPKEENTGAAEPAVEEMQEEEAPVELTKEERTTPPEGARVFFMDLENGATVSSPFMVAMGVEGMDILPAGEIVPGTGHHHILINNEEGFLERGEVVPMDEMNIHFGKGQMEHELYLEPGEYTISLQFGNGYHESYGKQMSKTIEIVVAD